MYTIVRHPGPRPFLERAAPWLEAEEDRHNLILGLSAAAVRKPDTFADPLFVTVEEDDTVVGCALRTPPHKLLLTAMPLEAAASVGRLVADLYDDLPAVLGRVDSARAAAEAWVEVHGARTSLGMRNGIYRADRAIRPEGVPGERRLATEDDLDLAAEWGEGFARDAGVLFPSSRETLVAWVRDGSLHLWEDGRPRSIAVAQGRTRRGVRVGYVYTPPELRGRGYAGALVADLTEYELRSGRGFCVLYTDMSNETSNALYERVGYELIEVVQDVLLSPAEDA